MTLFQRGMAAWWRYFWKPALILLAVAFVALLLATPWWATGALP